MLRLCRGIVATALASLTLFGAPPALAQSPADVTVTGGWEETGADGYESKSTFSCRGTPTCLGQFVSRTRFETCVNYLDESGGFNLSNLDLSRSGPIQGTVTGTSPAVFDITRAPNGICTVTMSGTETSTIPYTGNFDLATGTGSFTLAFVEDGQTVSLLVNFTAKFATPPPVFPMTVTSTITPTTANASAAIQFRPQDVGTSGSVYVFAVAPASQVKSVEGEKAVYVGNAWSPGKSDPPIACVLAQLNSSGQLQALTTAQLQAALTSTLTALGAIVPVITNASTPGVAGATFYVGFGANIAGMLNNGLFRAAVSVPGAGTCPMFSSQTSLWWNPAESGWGLNLNHQGNILFGALFTYDASGAPLWLVMSNGAMQADGVTFTGELFRTTGPAFNASPFTPIGAANLSRVGTMTASFIDANGGTLRYTVNGVEVTKAIRRQVYGSRAAACFPTTGSRAALTNYQDLWWNAAESGWGVNVTHQDNTMFATLFTYDANGRDLWLVMSNGARQADGVTFTGELFRTTGPPFNANPFTPISAANLSRVGTMSFRFRDGENATLDYTNNGAAVTKQITRQTFSDRVPACL